jgi:alpha-1,2-mannosyltransferase
MDVTRTAPAAAIGCVLLTEVLQNNLRNGQINFVVMACAVTFAWYWSRERMLLASTWLAAAIAVKITPAILLMWLARRREWKMAAIASAMAAVLTIGLPALVAGPRLVDDFRGYLQGFLSDHVASASGIIIERRPFSVVGALHRFTDLSWPLDAVVLAAAIVLITVLVFDRGRPASDREAGPLISLYLVAALLATPMSEVHHLAFVLPGVVWLVSRALGRELTGWRLVGLAFAIGSLMLRRSFHGAAFVGVVSLWILLAVELRVAPESRPRTVEGDAAREPAPARVS